MFRWATVYFSEIVIFHYSQQYIPDSPAELPDTLMLLFSHSPQVQHSKAQTFLLSAQGRSNSCLTSNKVTSRLSKHNKSVSELFRHE